MLVNDRMIGNAIVINLSVIFMGSLLGFDAVLPLNDKQVSTPNL